MNYSEKDIEQIEKLGIGLASVQAQIKRFKKGFPAIEIISNVSLGNGVHRISNTEKIDLVAYYNTKNLNKVKFVPASGAASRMFKLLFEFIERNIPEENEGIKTFFQNLEKFAFYDELEKITEQKGLDVSNSEGKRRLVSLLLGLDGLNYANLPKALLSFHRYTSGTIRKSIDEHLVEGAAYCTSNHTKVSLHFTISSSHRKLFNEHVKEVIPNYSKSFERSFNISFSEQDPATNTIAVGLDNHPIRDEKGALIFRPGGHGSLLKNLNSIDADIIFIKNIDNVVSESYLQETIEYKMALGAVLIQLQEKLFKYCNLFKVNQHPSNSLINEIVEFAKLFLGVIMPLNFKDWEVDAKTSYLFKKLNRPIRVCGVIKSKNTGGGPFWAKNSDGSVSLQLIETDQINLEDATQKTFLETSKYANITDLVIGVKDFKGNKFDLMDFCDPNTGFIAKKSLNGKPIKALEWPGLWNGAMSDWNTAFVEVPKSTFNPVKTVLDLLKHEHQ